MVIAGVAAHQMLNEIGLNKDNVIIKCEKTNDKIMRAFSNLLEYSVGLYYRKSQEDERQGESISIENQRMILRKYAEDHGFEIHDEYIDDGVSGTTFQRPEVQRLLDDAKTGVINTRHRNSKNLNGSESRLNRTGISWVR